MHIYDLTCKNRLKENDVSRSYVYKLYVSTRFWDNIHPVGTKSNDLKAK